MESIAILCEIITFEYDEKYLFEYDEWYLFLELVPPSAMWNFYKINEWIIYLIT